MNVLFITNTFSNYHDKSFFVKNKIILIIRISMAHNYATVFMSHYSTSPFSVFEVLAFLRKQGIGAKQKHLESTLEMEDEGLFKIRLSINQDSFFIQPI